MDVDSNVKGKQTNLLKNLLSAAGETRYGKQHHFNTVRTYSDFCKSLPINFYQHIAGHIEAMKDGTDNLLWPGKIDKFAVSSGTTGKGKHLPLSSERLRSDHTFMKKVVLSYLKRQPNIFQVLGKHLSLPGSIERTKKFSIGEISGFSAMNAPWWLRPFQLEEPRELVKLAFKDKFEKILQSALASDIKVIIGVPSWILTLFQQALHQTGKSTVAEVWPNLKLLVCGGVKLANYQPHLEKLYGKSGLNFIETYGSSEGYFAYSNDLVKNDMSLVYDNGIFYEFIPNPLPDPDSLSIQPAVPLWEVETGVPYAMIVTTNAGLWRYAMNDIISFTSADPPRINVMGRLNEMLDTFGEAVHLYEAEQVLDSVLIDMEIEHGAFAIGGLMESEFEQPCHYWFIQFMESPHQQTLDRLAKQIDHKLRRQNRHYAIRRESGALGSPKVHSLTQQDINSWLEAKGNDRAQGKLPKLLNRREDVAFFL